MIIIYKKPDIIVDILNRPQGRGQMNKIMEDDLNVNVYQHKRRRNQCSPQFGHEQHSNE